MFRIDKPLLRYVILVSGAYMMLRCLCAALGEAARTRAGARAGGRSLKARAPRRPRPTSPATETLNYFIGKANETRAIQWIVV